MISLLDRVSEEENDWKIAHKKYWVGNIIGLIRRREMLNYGLN